MTDFEYLVEHLSEAECLAQLAEEASELAQAALKLRRTIAEGAFPTPVTEGEAFIHIKEENEDVLFSYALWVASREKRIYEETFVAQEWGMEEFLKARAKRLRTRMEGRK